MCVHTMQSKHKKKFRSLGWEALTFPLYSSDRFPSVSVTGTFYIEIFKTREEVKNNLSDFFPENK